MIETQMMSDILAWLRGHRLNGFRRPGKIAAGLKVPRKSIDKALDALVSAGLAEKNAARHREFRLMERPDPAGVLVRPATPMPWRPLRGYEATLNRHRELCEATR